jgi:hypothetical protein
MAQKKIMKCFIVLALFFCSLQCSAVEIQKYPIHKKHKHPIQHPKHKPATMTHQHVVHSHTLEKQEEAPVLTSTTPTSHSLISTIGEHMVRFVHSTLSTLRYTAYKLGGTHFDSSNGIYIVDCSDYVDHLLKVTNPPAYLSLVNSSGSDKPTSEHYYHFFTDLTYKPRHYWNKVENVKELQPGDILVFRNKKNSHTGISGHVMVVMNKPIQANNSFLVRVTDSASSGHSQDTRLPHTSGIGIGTMQLKVNPSTGQPSAYAWKLGSTFESHVNFAMARPIGQ